MMTSRLGHLVQLINESAAACNGGFTVALEDIEGGTGRLMAENHSREGSIGAQFQPGDVLYGKLRPYLRKVWVADRPGIALGDIHVYRPHPDVDSRFIEFALLSDMVAGAIESSVYGTKMPRANWEFIKSVPIQHYGPREQINIADFLDRETAKMDAVIKKQRALVGGLRGRRQAVIRRAVLGRDKESFKPVGEGSPWVREVPADWHFIPLGYRYNVVLGKMLDAGREPRTDDSDLPYVRAANIQESGLDLSSTNTMPFTSSEVAKFSLQSGDLLVVEGGSVGVSVLLEKDMDGWAFQKTVNRVRSSGESSTRYLHYVLNAYRTAGVFGLICGGSTIAHLTSEKLAALKIPVPPIAEQHEITSRLDCETARIDALIARSERLIELSQERRSALITAAVTGQIDTPSDTMNLEGAA